MPTLAPSPPELKSPDPASVYAVIDGEAVAVRLTPPAAVTVDSPSISAQTGSGVPDVPIRL